MKSLTLTVTLPDDKEEDTETLFCGFAKLLTQQGNITDYVIHHVTTEKRTKRGPYSPEEDD